MGIFSYKIMKQKCNMKTYFFYKVLTDYKTYFNNRITYKNRCVWHLITQILKPPYCFSTAVF